MIDTAHACKRITPAFGLKDAGRWRYARNVTEREETDANRYAPAAILECDRCGARAVIEGSNKHPRAAAERVPDQSVFE
jgi:hypothetical protein